MNKIFFIVFKNKILCNLIFSKVHHIHRDIFLFKEINIFKWNRVLKNIYLLSYHNYLNEIKQHHNSIDKNLFKNNTLIDFITKGDSLDVLQYFIDQQPELLTFKSHSYRMRDIRNDLLFFSIKYNSMKIFNYLESLSNNNNNSTIPTTTLKVEWDYYNALSAVPEKGDLGLFLYISEKIDIKRVVIENRNDDNEYLNIIETIVSSATNARFDMLDHIFGIIDSKEIVKAILVYRAHSIIEGVIRKCGHLSFINKYYINNDIQLQSTLSNVDLISECAKYNRFEMMKYFHDNQIGRSSFYAMDNAMLSGNFEIFKWLHENRTEGCTTKSMNYAAKEGKLEIIKWLHENRTEGCTRDAMYLASANGHIEIVKWLHHNRTEGCSTKAMDIAARTNHLDIIKWLHENRTEGCSTNAMNSAANGGHLDVVKWLHHNRTEGCTSYAMDSAVTNGHFETLEWLHHNRTEGCTTGAMDLAAYNGRLDIVKWLHHNRTEGCTNGALEKAAFTGNIEILKWLLDNRTESITPDVFYSACVEGHLDILKYLVGISPDTCQLALRELISAAERNRFSQIVEYLRDTFK